MLSYLFSHSFQRHGKLLSTYANNAVPARINGISLARLASVVNSRATTSPTLDPSFYGTTQLVLSSLEVSLAIVAASLPVFWPMMTFGWGNIFVTTVITVQHQDGSDIANDKTSYTNSCNRNNQAEPWKAEVEDISAADNTKKETYEDEEALFKKPLPVFKTWIAPREDEEALVVKPLPDFRNWKLARDRHATSSLYASTVC